MNNSKIAFDMVSLETIEPKSEEILPKLREKESELVKIIEAISGISETVEWEVLERAIFDKLVETLDRRMTMETNKQELNNPEIYRLQGQLIWARKYADFGGLADAYRAELTNIRQTIKQYGNENTNG